MSVNTVTRVSESAPQQVSTPKRKGRRRGQRSAAASIGLHATLIVASIIAVFPLFWVLVISFKPNSKAVTAEPSPFGDSSVDNYVDILTGLKGPFLTWF